MEHYSHLLIETEINLTSLCNEISDIFQTQNEEVYKAPLEFKRAKTVNILQQMSKKGRYHFQFSGNVKDYLSKLGTDASQLELTLQEGLDGIDKKVLEEIGYEQTLPVYVLTAKVNAEYGGEIGNGDYFEAVVNGLYHFGIKNNSMPLIHGNEKGYKIR